MSTITTQAADRFLRESDPSFVINSVLDTRSIGIGNDGSTETVVSSICPINSFSIFDRIIEEKTIDFIFGLVDDIGLIEGDMEGEVVVGRVDSSDGQDEYTPDSNSYDFVHVS